MTAVVIDTNVLLVANNAHEDISPDCVKICVERLQNVRKNGVVVIDDAWRIVGEYLNKTNPNQPKGVGDVFLKWLLQNVSNPKYVQQVTLTQTAPDCFEEFPALGIRENFDLPDRKFVAAANAHPDAPAIWQAADCKWLDWCADLRAAGIRIDFLCLMDAHRFYQAKFPDKTIPDIPDQ